MIDMIADTALLAAAVRLATPIAFAALGGVLAERSGVYNVALEGMILVGAFGAAAGSFASGSALVGLGAGMAGGALTGLVLALLVVTLRVNQLVAGIALNLLCAGLTAFSARLVFGAAAGSAPVAGFTGDPLTWALFALTAVVTVWLYRTQGGLRLRATGENPRAADSAGIGVFGLRYAALIASGAIAALGGCHIVLAQVFVFTEHISAGKGFIALAAIILGRWHPVWGVAAALFFGLCDAAQLRLQFDHPDIPYQMFLILPFVASILALAWVGRQSRAPAATGQAYDREAR